MPSDDAKSGANLGAQMMQMTIRPGLPVEVTELEGTASSVTAETDHIGARVADTLKAYLLAADELLKGRYASLSTIAPRHMTASCYPRAFIFPDGVLVRYDREDNPGLHVVAAVVAEGGLSEWAPTLSEHFVHYSANPGEYDPGEKTITLALALSSDAVPEREFVRHRLAVVVGPANPVTQDSNTSKNRRLPLVSVRNEFDYLLEIRADPKGPAQKRALIRTPIRLPVGWEAIQLYPPFEPETWNPELAPLWAESDLLAAILQRNVRDNQYRALDPNAEARKRMSKLLADFEKLLNGDEEPLHQFIKQNPILLSPTHTRVWSKLPLGKRITDFVFRQSSGEYLLVELERASRLLFRNDGQQHAELTHAVDQVLDWRRYIEDNLSTVQKELDLKDISVSPASLIVIGRSSSLTIETRRKLTALENTMPKIKIWTYDDLLANARAVAENFLGPLWQAGPNTELYFLPENS